MKISEAIKEIIKLKGLTIFNDYKRFKGFLADFSTDTHKRELDVFKNAVDENMLKMCIDDSLEERRKILKLQIQLENKGLTQDWINFIIKSFALPLGWNYTPKPTSQEQTKQVQKQNTSSSQNEWTCFCGTVNTTNFCGNCGSAKPEPKSLDWTCVCGTVNTTKFCGNCGKPKGQQQTQQVQKQKTSTQQKPSIQQQQQAKQQITKQTQTQQKQQAQQSVQKLGNPFKNAKVGDYIKFGSYPQTSNGQVQPIEWQVLSKENNKMLVISKYGLDARRFDSSSNNWENSEIRQWLNSEFYNKAFNDNEKKLIRNSSISTIVYRKVKKETGFWGSLFGQEQEELVESSKFTDDRVFLLSKEEAEKYFANNTARQCKPTEYAKKNDAYVDSSNGYSWWWLRSPYPSDSNYVCLVYYDGFICSNRVNYVNNAYDVVRPALWINL